MTARLLRAFLWAAIVLVTAGTLLGLASVASSAWGGGAAKTTLPLRIEPAHTSAVTGRFSAKPVGQLVLDRGTLEVRAGGTGYAALQAVDIFVTGGLWLVILWSALRLFRQISEGKPFSGSTVTRLRTIGVSMILLNCWMWLRMVTLSPVLLAALNPASGEYRILPAIAASADGVRSARIDTSFGIGLLAAGLLILLLSEAFRIGAALREDSESIV